MGGFSQASKVNKTGVFTNLVVDGQSNYGNDVKQFGQLLANLLGHCHGSSEYTQVNIVVCINFNVLLILLRDELNFKAVHKNLFPKGRVAFVKFWAPDYIYFGLHLNRI